MNQEQKEHILKTVETWLEEASQEEELPEGFPETEVAPADQPDLFSIVKAMTVLSEDFRIQGKSFRKLQEEVQKLSNRPEQAAGQSSAAAQPVIAVSDLIENAREEGRKEILIEMMEIHDRLCRTLDECARKLGQTGFFSDWLGNNEVQKAMVEGLRITRSRYDDFLSKQGIQQFARMDDSFDPATMKAIDAIRTLGVPPGKIIGIIHYGYRRHGKVIRPAEVMVSK